MTGTLYQCLNFLARHNGVISLAPHPENPCKTRMVIKIDGDSDEVLATIEFPCTAEMDVFEAAIKPTCTALMAQVEGE